MLCRTACGVMLGPRAKAHRHVPCLSPRMRLLNEAPAVNTFAMHCSQQHAVGFSTRHTIAPNHEGRALDGATNRSSAVRVTRNEWCERGRCLVPAAGGPGVQSQGHARSQLGSHMHCATCIVLHALCYGHMSHGEAHRCSGGHGARLGQRIHRCGCQLPLQRRRCCGGAAAGDALV